LEIERGPGGVGRWVIYLVLQQARF
jgi:hypothetical protein